MKIEYRTRDDGEKYLFVALDDKWVLAEPLASDAEVPALFRAIAVATERHFKRRTNPEYVANAIEAAAVEAGMSVDDYKQWMAAL